MTTKYILLLSVTALFSCQTDKKDDNLSNNPVDTLKSKDEKIVYDDRRENLKLSTTDTIKISKSYFFSTPSSKDIFLLTVNPGLVKNSKSILQ